MYNPQLETFIHAIVVGREETLDIFGVVTYIIKAAG